MLALHVLFFIIFVLFLVNGPFYLVGNQTHDFAHEISVATCKRATRAEGVAAIDAAHFHDLHTLCISSISETLMKTETFVGVVCY